MYRSPPYHHGDGWEVILYYRLQAVLKGLFTSCFIQRSYLERALSLVRVLIMAYFGALLLGRFVRSSYNLSQHSDEKSPTILSIGLAVVLLGACACG